MSVNFPFEYKPTKNRAFKYFASTNKVKALGQEAIACKTRAKYVLTIAKLRYYIATDRHL